MRKKPSLQKWVVFVCGCFCIAAAGVSSHFFNLLRREREDRIAAENELKTLSSEFQLLKEKNRELAEQLVEAKRIAEELAREKEGMRVAAMEVPPSPGPSPNEPPIEKPMTTAERKGKSLVEVLKSFPAERLAAAAGKLRDSSGNGWRTFRTALVATASSPGPEGSSVPSQGKGLLEVLKSFPLTAVAQAATEVGSSARKAIGAVREAFPLRLKAPVASASPEVPSPLNEPKKLTATNEELRTELEEVRQEKRDLEKQIAERTGKLPGSVDVGQVKIATGRRFSGKVLVVNREHDFVVIDVGRNQGLEKGEVFIVHRGNTFIGKAQVIKVYEKMAAADLIKDWMQDEVEVNDGVKKF